MYSQSQTVQWVHSSVEIAHKARFLRLEDDSIFPLGQGGLRLSERQVAHLLTPDDQVLVGEGHVAQFHARRVFDRHRACIGSAASVAKGVHGRGSLGFLY